MAAKPTRAAAKKKAAAAAESSQSIEAQTKAFLEKGGEIEQISTGVSGQQSMAGPKHIRLGNHS
jgi:RecA/RadA recombinase